MRDVIDSAPLASAAPGRRVVVPARGISLELFDGERLAVEPLEAAVRAPLAIEPGGRGEKRPSVEWLGVARSKGAITVQVSLAFTPQEDGGYSVAGSVMRPGGQILISAAGGPPIYRLDELSPSSSLPQGNDVANTTSPTTPNSTPAPAPLAGTTAAATGAAVTVDVIVAFANGNPADIVSRVSAKVAETNNAMAASGMNERLNLLAIPYVNYWQHPSDMLQDIIMLQDGVGALNSLHTLREQLGADLVGLVVPNQNTACGYANNIPPAGGNSTIAWQVSANYCFDADRHVLAHEFGHLLGGRHNPEVDSTASPYPYSHGKAVNAAGRTVMAYDSTCPNQCSMRLQFSNPAINLFGTGVPSGDTTQRNNSQSLNNLAPSIGAYRSSFQPGPDTESPARARGDFNGDGREDVAAFYNLDNGNTGLRVWYSTGSGFNAPVQLWTSGVGKGPRGNYLRGQRPGQASRQR